MTNSLKAASTSINRRVATRRQPALGTVCRMDLGHNKKPILGLVWNLSSSGVSMLLHEPLEPGTVIVGALTTEEEGTSLPIRLRAVHLNKIRTGDYFLGAKFESPLSLEEMRPFLGEKTLEKSVTE
jgi:hypothetical protein